MPEKILVYSKNTGEQRVPLTVRIDWLPDGTIKPCLYWTPDGSCYEVKKVYDFVNLAHLKDRDVGIRFRVRAEIAETPESYPDRRFEQHETYLFFLDNWFCGRNIIDSRYGHAGKEYIPVTLDIFPDCSYELISFSAQGARYMVEKTLSVEPHGSFFSGGVGVRHKVDASLVSVDNDTATNKIANRPAALFFEINKWFVSVKNVKAG
jgi:hypothetical protein